jgi:hypothetical protein
MSRQETLPSVEPVNAMNREPSDNVVIVDAVGQRGMKSKPDDMIKERVVSVYQ